MDAIADALVYATAYLSIATGDDDREHDDCRALESISDMLSRCSEAERDALVAAADRAIAAESRASSPNLTLTNAYRDFLDNLHELFPKDGNS